MKSKIFYFILAFCLIAKPISAKSLRNSFTMPSKDQGVSLLSDDDVSKEEPDNDDLEKDELEEGISKYLPQFFQNNKQMLKTLQQGKRQAVVVIGQTGAGKSTLIGGLLGHKFVLEDQHVSGSDSDTDTSYEEEVLINKTSGAPKIGNSDLESETILPSAYLDPKTNLAFIDTAGLGDVRKDGDAINLCNAIGLRSLIEQIGGIKCIIGVIRYNNVIDLKASKAFVNLLNATKSMLKNTSPETLASSMVLALTKVPENTQQKKVTNKLKKICRDLKKKKKNNQMTDEDKTAEPIYKTLFPSYYGIKNKKNVSFFLISQKSILQQGLVRKNMLTTLQSAKKVDKKDIGLVLTPYLLQKTRDWLEKRGVAIAKDISAKEAIETKINNLKNVLSSEEKKLTQRKELLKDLKNPDKKTKEKKEVFNKQNTEFIKKNKEQIQNLDKKIEEYWEEMNNKILEKGELDTDEIKKYKSIAPRKEENKYKYSYKDVKIQHIFYDDKKNETKDPVLHQYVGKKDEYQIVSMEENYPEGTLKMDLKRVAQTGFFSWLFSNSSSDNPKNFNIYAKKKDIYRNTITSLTNNIKVAADNWFDSKCDKKRLEEENQLSEEQNQLVTTENKSTEQLESNNSDNNKQASSDLEEQEMQKITTSNINKTKKEIKSKELTITNLSSEKELLNKKIKKQQIILDIITHVEPFITFYKHCKRDIKLCKQYVKKTKEKNNKENNRSKYAPPKNFNMYAKKQHTNSIKSLKYDIQNLEKVLFERTQEKEHMQREKDHMKNVLFKKTQEKNYMEQEVQRRKHHLQQFQSNNLRQNQLKNNRFGNQNMRHTSSHFVRENEMIKKIEMDIKHTEQVINKIEMGIKHNEQVIKKTKHEHQTLLSRLVNFENNNTNNKHTDYQSLEELEERKEDDDYDNNNNNSSLTSSILWGTTIVSGSLLKKKN